MLIQSDKAKYKPGNTVQFRIIVLDQDLMGRVADVSYEIKSPSQNMMAQGQLASQNGVVQGRFQLDAFAEQGEWKIQVILLPFATTTVIRIVICHKTLATRL